jgi:hypothetical protein
MKEVRWMVGVTTYEAFHILPILGPSVIYELLEWRKCFIFTDILWNGMATRLE